MEYDHELSCSLTKQDFVNHVLEAHSRSHKRAYDLALETKTALVFSRGGRIVEIYPHLGDLEIYSDEESTQDPGG